ncbi:mRNA export factor mex67 [Aspergillus ellipticus CBS 707.79]|uniref:mRNA export factor MEX67 n=1 Tax=Aspergillus ellipticus CBS 707.79 TaxID=1448320 RepID=A0A319DG21_9EURO|nr:mRNA export factor mex67 [Aspergillus ellipticus CBS 707.79]
MKNGKGSRGRQGTSDRGGIRKRGAATRVDREGDLMMDAGSARNRGGKKARGESGRSGTTSRTQAANKAMDAIQRAISSNSDSQANIRQSGRGSGLEQVMVRGWKQSKAASNRDGGLESLIAFLEKKLSTPDSKAGTRARITKSRVEGDALIVSIRPELLDRMLQLSGFSFAGAPLSVHKFDRSANDLLDQPMLSSLSQNGTSPSAADTKAKMTAVLGRRYAQQTKLLDLSRLGSDPDLLSMGIFGSTSTESKFFPALMKVWELNFDNAAARREAVESVSLADNQLANITAVTTLAQTIPELKNLDLSNNDFKDPQALIGWRWKFRNLEFLDLSNTPFSSDPTFKDTMLKWYPKLRFLNNVEVRTVEELAAQKKTPIPVQAPHFRDESQIAENFVRAFFAGYDNDRSELLNGVYDKHSTFTLNVNTSAPRAQQTEPAPWDAYIKKSRNLLKINHLPARMSRAYNGADKIRELWTSLPATRHPDITAHPNEWLIECYPIPGLPDPSGQSSTGVGGLLIMVHGKFDEISGTKVETRSFDRTFILGPGGGMGGIRVINDILCLRAYGGHEAWAVENQPAVPQAAAPAAPLAAPVAAPPAAALPGAVPGAPDGYGMPVPGKPDAQVQQEQLVLQMSSKTRMTLQYSEMALTGNGWNIDVALKNFEELKTQGTLPPDAFLPGP